MDIAAIIAKKRVEACPLSILLTLASKAPAYDLPRNLRLLAGWLSPIESCPEATWEQCMLVHNWKLGALANASNLSQAQIIYYILHRRVS